MNILIKKIMKVKSLILLFCLSLLYSCTSDKTDGKTILLSKDSRAEAVIVIPEKPSAPVKFAAQQLKHYLDKITGANFKISNVVPENQPAIILGEKLGKRAGIDVSKIKRDGFTIKTIGDKIYIAGKDDQTEKSQILFRTLDKNDLPEFEDSVKRYQALTPTPWDFERGTLHGAYDFLEKLGVRWFFPGPKGEVIPEASTLTVLPINCVEEPFFDLRYVRSVIFPHKAKNRYFIMEEYEDLGWTGLNQCLWLVRNRVSSKWMAFNHRPHRHQWGKRFRKTHPEYFALLKNGKRASGPPNSKHEYLNYTSKGMLKETVADMDAFFSGKKPETRRIKSQKKCIFNNGWMPTAAYGNTFTLIPNDGLRVDNSPESQKYLREDAPLFYRHTNYIWQFVDKAARKLRQIHPDKKVICLAYQSYCAPPDVIETLPDNVIIGIAALSGPSRIHVFAQPKKKQEYIDFLKSWRKICPGPMFFWDYWLWRYKQPDHEGIPMFAPHLAQDFIKTRAEYGKYMYMGMDSMNFMFNHFNRYAVFRLLWNPDIDIDKLIDDYCKSFYGPAADPMKEFFNDIENKCHEIARNNVDYVGIWENYFNKETLEKYRSEITKAKQLAAKTKYEKNVNLMEKWFLKPMENTRQKYVKNIKRLVEQGKNILYSSKTSPKAVKVDGIMDDHTWKVLGGKSLYNNVNGRYVREKVKIRIRHSDTSLFFCFNIDEPNAKNIVKQEKKDSVEIFLDANNDRETYYWLYITIDGKVIERFYPGPGEPPNDWNSNTRIVTKLNDTGWVVEVEVPFKSIGLTGKNLDELEMGALCCLTRIKHLANKLPETFNTSNPILRGAFHQPAMFGRLRFRNPKNNKIKVKN